MTKRMMQAMLLLNFALFLGTAGIGYLVWSSVVAAIGQTDAMIVNARGAARQAEDAGRIAVERVKDATQRAEASLRQTAEQATQEVRAAADRAADTARQAVGQAQQLRERLPDLGGLPGR